MEKKLAITFYGGTSSPTGSNFMISDGMTSILVDCGLFQGKKVGEDVNRKNFSYDPKMVDALFITHSHIDHIGRVPKLVRDGFSRSIYSTPPTRDISERMLEDTLGILEKEAREEGLSPIYEKNDVQKVMSSWKEIGYHQEVNIGEFRVRLRDAGHILGSALVEFIYNDKSIIFTGDLGNSPTPLLKDTESLEGVDYLIIESVYGDRNHEDKISRKSILEDVIEDTIKKGGVLMIPAFSLERTQELLYELNDLIEHGRIPEVPVFIDSPLAIDVTKIYKKYKEYFNKEARATIKDGDDIFNFKGLKFTYETEESKAIRNVPSPKIIIAGSGMSNGGRIIHHEKEYLKDPKNTLLIVGYQVPGSLGRELQDGSKTVTIFNQKISVNAKVKTIHGYSAHKDSDALLDAIASAGDSLKKVFVVLGEPKSSLFLVQRIRDYLGVEAVVPGLEETVEIVV